MRFGTTAESRTHARGVGALRAAALAVAATAIAAMAGPLRAEAATVTRYPSSNQVVTTGWSSPTSAYADDTAYATAAPGGRNTTVDSNFGGFGFDGDIPAGSTINSVTLEVGWSVSTTASIATLGAQPYVSGALQGSELVNTAEPVAIAVQSQPYTLTRDQLLDAVFQVRVRATRGNSGTAVTASLDFVRVTVDFTAPSPPPVPGAPSPSTGTITTGGFTATWSPSAGATSYTLDVDGDPGFTAPLVATYSPATNAQTVSGLAANTLYYLRARATGPGGTSAYSSPPGQGTTLSNAPGTPSFSGTTTAQTTVTWAPPVGNGGASLTYLVERATDPAFTQNLVQTPGVAGTSSLQGGLLASTTYHFRVKAVNAGGTSAASLPNSVVTAAGSGGGTTTIGDGVALGTTQACPSGPSAPLDAFTAGATIAADLVTSVTVELSPAGAYQNVALVEVTDPAATPSIVYGSAVPTSDTVVISTTGLSAVLGTPADYRVRVTPRTHGAMPPRSVGRSIPASGRVTEIVSTNATKTYADTTSGTVVLDNGSPASPSWSAVTTGTNAITVGWSLANPPDVAAVLVLRRQGGPVTDGPGEGDTSFGATLGSSTVVYSGGTGTTSRAMNDTPDGTPFYFAAFARDACGNWSLGAPLGPIVPPGAMEGYAVAPGDPPTTRPVVSIVNPAKNAVVSGRFRVQVRVASPAAGGPVSVVRLSTSGGSPTCDAASFPIVLCASPRYGTTAQGGIWETQAGAAAPCSDHLTLTAGAGYTLRACAVNGSGSVNSAAVGISIAPASRPGDGKLLVRDDSNQLCTDCHAVKAHDSEATSGKYGSWALTCRDCHTPHGTTNVLLVAPVIQPPQYRGYQPPKKVVFTNRSGSGAGTAGDGSYTNADGTGACQVCHTRTRYYRADNTQPETHETGNCQSCHEHQQGMSGAGGCTNCHGDEARVAATGSDPKVKFAPPRDSTDVWDVTDPQVGAHEKHVNTEGSTLHSPPLACDECHLGYVHGDGDVDLGWGTLATTRASAPAWNVPAGAYTCATTYCHAGMPGGTTPAPVWTSTAGTLGCGSCHGAPPPLTANHPQNTACGSCHDGYTSGTVADTSRHVNGSVEATTRTGCTACHGEAAGRSQVSTVGTADANLAAAPPIDSRGRSASSDAGVGAHLAHADPGRAKGWSKPFGCEECHTVPTSGDVSHANGAYAFSPGTIAVAISYSGSPGYTCANTYCHALPGAEGTNQAPGWTAGATATSCTSCHAALPPVSDAGHPQNPTCSGCHGGYTSSSVQALTHVDGLVQHSPASGCNACHGDLSAAPAAPGAIAAAPGVNAGSVDTTGATAVTALGVGAHREHLVATASADAFACADCHLADYAVGDVAHANSTASVPLNGLARTGGAAAAYASPSCSNVYCHSRAFPLGGTQAYATPLAWNGGATITGCTACHGGQGSALTPTTLSPVHAVHVDGGTGNYGYECVRCHANEVATNTSLSAGGLALHVNGARDWRFDALQPNASYASSTCTNTYCHSSGTDRTGPDFTSAATPSWNGGTITGCVACHGGPVGAGQLVTGKHANHVNLAGTIGGAASTNVACGTCHSTTVAIGTNAPVTTYSNHVDQQPDVVLDAAWGGTFTAGASEGTGSCASSYCHSTGQDPAATNASRYKTIAWTATTGCRDCHGAETGAGTFLSTAGEPNYASAGAGAPSANSHQQHVAGAGDCQDCHVETVTAAGTGILATSALHLDRSRQVSIRGALDGNTNPNDNYATTTKQCSNVTCHGGNTVTWGGPALACKQCHSTTATETEDFVAGFWSNDVTSTINDTEWLWSGHGKTAGTFDVTGNAAPAFSTTVAGKTECTYCHDPAIAHRTPTNPFRLRGKSLATGGQTFAPYDATVEPNAPCLSCHAPNDFGVDPDAGGAALNRNGAKNMGTAHAGAKHAAGTLGGKFCWDCHDPHGDRPSNTNSTSYNIAMIRAQVFVTQDGTYGYADAASRKPVEFYNRTPAQASPSPVGRIVETTTAAGTDHRGLCQACHDPSTASPATKYWARDGRDDPDGAGGAAAYASGNTAGANHNTTQYCVGCHPHDDNFAGQGTCLACHGATADSDEFGPSFWTSTTAAKISTTEWAYSGHGKTSGNYDGSGNLPANLPTLPTPGESECRYCHDETTAHAPGASTNPYRLRGVASGTGVTAAYAPGTANAVCLNCHGSTSSPGVTPSGQENKKATQYSAASHYGAKHTDTEGGKFCWDCHDPHGDRASATTAAGQNILMIRSQVFQATDGRHGITPTLKSVTFNNVAGGPPTLGKLVEATTATRVGLCQACHDPAKPTTESTKYWRWNGTDDPDGASGAAAYASTHNSGETAPTYCVKCHPHADNFKGTGSCLGCHSGQTGSGATLRARIVGGAAGSEGDDFIRRSRHVSNGTTTTLAGNPANTGIVTDYDCILCHAEGDVTSAGAGANANIKTVTANHGADGGTTTVDLRNVDSPGGTGIAAAWPGKRLSAFTATTTDRDAMDTFCMSCHDANGASTVAVSKATQADGMLLPPTAAQALKPFNVNDNLRNANEPAPNGTVTPKNLAQWRLDNGKLTNVKSQFNSGNAYGKLWASHHNLNQFKLRYETSAGVRATNNVTHWPTAAWTPPDASPAAGEVGMTLEGKRLDAGTADTGFAVGLHCADCHLNESNAHGSRATWYMLQNKSGTDTAFVSTGTTAATDICSKCHNPAVYGEGSTNTDSAASRVQAHEGSDGRCNNIAGPDQAGFARLGGDSLPCLGCHGGYGGPSNSNADGTGATNVGPGLIHGTNAAYQPYNTGGFTRMYRFMGSGGSYRYYSPKSAANVADTDWEAVGTTGCYTIGAVDTWGTCAKHSGTSPATPNRARPLQY